MLRRRLGDQGRSGLLRETTSTLAPRFCSWVGRSRREPRHGSTIKFGLKPSDQFWGFSAERGVMELHHPPKPQLGTKH